MAACLAVFITWAPGSVAQPKVHGADSLFVTPTVKLAWGVVRGKAEADAQVVIRVLNVAGEYRFMRVDGVDPFTKAHAVLAEGRPLGASTDIAIVRDKFVDHPSVELHFFRDEAALRAQNAALVVYYLGVPDTTPEFATAAAMDAYFSKMLDRGRSP
jgi:hypothetical protein